MFNLKTCLVIMVLVGFSCGQRLDRYKKKHHHHHYGMHHHHFLYYLTFLAIKLKIVFFLGTIFTIGMVAAKVVAILKFSEYMKHKYHHEEKIIYTNPHEHHEYGGGGGYYGGDIISSKTYPGYSQDFSLDHPPSGAYIGDSGYDSAAGGPPEYASEKISAHARSNEEGTYGGAIYGQLMAMADRMRQLNLTDMALNEMGIKQDDCKKKFVCKADFNARGNVILQTAFDILRDVSYQRHKPNATVTSEEECDRLYQQCSEHATD